MNAATKNLLIGIFVSCAIGMIAFILLFLHPKVGDQGQTLHVRFTDIDKVTTGTRVTFAGRPVGEVVEIQELPEVRNSRTNIRGDVYVYELALKIDSKVDVFNTDCIMLRTSGLLGERNIEINPCPPKPGASFRKIDPGEILYATPAPSVEDTIQQLTSLTQKIDLVIDDLHTIFMQVQEEKIVQTVGKNLRGIGELINTINQPDAWRATVDHVASLAKKADEGWTKVDHILDDFSMLSSRFRGSYDVADRGIRSLAHAAEQADSLLSMAVRGEGTFGKIWTNDELYLRAKAFLSKGERVMDDVNTYGLLFHTNRRWQRLYARRLHLLEKLSSPSAFTEYFQKEIHQISDSLDRVSWRLDQTACYPDSLLEDCSFTHSFKELLNKVEHVEETLKMYNEQLVDP